MKLKQKFFTQSIFILVGTILITGCVGFFYSYFYNLVQSSAGSEIGETIVVVENDNIIYKNEDFSNIQVKEILMNISMGNHYFDHEKTRYRISSEEFTTQKGNQHQVVSLHSIDTGSYYPTLVTLVFITFFLVFVLASTMVRKQNMKNMINPIIDLTQETENLRRGDLETAISDQGFGEIKDLARAIERLRLQLKNTVYYQERVDENRKFLISSISHDLKTPVTSIRGYIDGVLDGVADTDEKKQYYLSKAVEKTQLLNIMIEDLLLYSKLDLNQEPFDKEEVGMVAYMEQWVKDNLDEFHRVEKNIMVENELKNEVYVAIDAKKFNRVFQNLADNAKRNIEKKTGWLKVILRETNSSLIIEFKDNGVGISKENLPHIFDRFYRADTAREVKGSSGLGLAIAKQIVEGMGGRIWAISEVGEGTSIIISLKKVN